MWLHYPKLIHRPVKYYVAKSKGSDLLQSEILHLSVPLWDMLRVTIYITLQVDHKWVEVSTTVFKHIARLGPTPDAAR